MTPRPGEILVATLGFSVLLFVAVIAVSWALLAGLAWAISAVFGTSPFAANGVEVLLGAILLARLFEYLDRTYRIYAEAGEVAKAVKSAD